MTAAPLNPTSTMRGKPIRHSNFNTLCDGLDYAATCDTGLNFFNGKGVLVSSLPYSELRERAVETAKRLTQFAPKDARIGIARKLTSA